MRWDKLVYVLVAPILSACWHDADDSSTLQPPTPVTIRAIQALPHEPLGALVQHDAAGPSPIRISTPRRISQIVRSPPTATRCDMLAPHLMISHSPQFPGTIL
jgi:hypothetical protein